MEKYRNTLASLVWEISKQLMVFSSFSLPQIWFVTFLADRRRASATYNILKANWVVFGWYFYKCKKKNSLLKLLYLPFFRLNMWHLSRKQLTKFLFWFWHRKNDTRLYAYTYWYLFSYKIPHHLLNALELEYASFNYCRKRSPKMFVMRKLIFYLNLNHQHICKEYSQTKNTKVIYFTGNFFFHGVSSYNQIMSSQHIPPNVPGLLSCLTTLGTRVKRHG